MSPQAPIPGRDNAPENPPVEAPTSQSPDEQPRTIRWSGIVGTTLVVLGTVGTILGFLLFFDEDPTAGATLGAGVQLLVTGVVIKVLIEIWVKIPGPERRQVEL